MVLDFGKMAEEDIDYEEKTSLKEITKLIISGEVEAGTLWLDTEQKDEVIKVAVKKIKSLKNRTLWLVVIALAGILGTGGFGYQWYEEKEKNKVVKALYEEIFGSSNFIDNPEVSSWTEGEENEDEEGKNPDSFNKD